MSIIIVTFPGAPQVSKEAIDKDQEFEAHLRQRIKGKIAIVYSSMKLFNFIGITDITEVVQLCDNEDDVDGEYVLRILMNQEIPGVPPGAGLHAM